MLKFVVCLALLAASSVSGFITGVAFKRRMIDPPRALSESRARCPVFRY